MSIFLMSRKPILLIPTILHTTGYDTQLIIQGGTI